MTKSINCEDHWSGLLKDGGGLLGIMKIALMGCISAYGAFPEVIKKQVTNDQYQLCSLQKQKPSAISNEVMPRLQISATQS